jgi:S1-C subfamily serine protease
MEQKNTLQTVSEELGGLVRTVAPSVYLLGYDEGAPRSGFQLDAQRVVTIARWAEAGEEVSLYDHTGGRTVAKVIGFDMTSGVTVLEREGAPLEIARETDDDADQELPLVGTLSVAVALPSPDGVEARLGMIRCVGGATRLRRGRRVSRYLQTDAQTFPGFLGGPLLDVSGRLLGITMEGGHGDGFVLPLHQLRLIVEQLKDKPTTGLGYLGVVTQSATLPEGITAQREGQKNGLVVTEVEEDSPAGKGGVLVGDILLSLDGVNIETTEDLMDALLGKNDQSVEIALSRGERIVTLSVEAGAARWRRSRHHGRRFRRHSDADHGCC